MVAAAAVVVAVPVVGCRSAVMVVVLLMLLGIVVVVRGVFVVISEMTKIWSIYVRTYSYEKVQVGVPIC